MSKPAITYCCLHAKHEVKPIHLNRGLNETGCGEVYNAVQHIWIQRSVAISNTEGKRKCDETIFHSRYYWIYLRADHT